MGKSASRCSGFFKEKLKERLENPHNPKSRLSGGNNIYKIKTHSPPYRLTYHVNDNELIVTAMSVGRRDGAVYKKMIDRLSKNKIYNTLCGRYTVT